MLWQDDQLATVASVLAAARSGEPTVLTVVGAAGLGKSSLLQEIVRRAPDFEVLEGAGEAGYSEPYRVLRHLGVDDVLTATGAAKEPLQAAQGLRAVADGLAGPVLVVVDDLQWADRESVEALYWLFHRAAGDQLLVAVGTRPEGADALDVWRRLASRGRGVRSIELTGLSLPQARALVDGPEHTVRRLWEHTEGNPLYLSSLVNRYDLTELEGMRELPAPVELAASVEARLADASPDAVAVLQTAAVLGHVWTDVPTLGAVAEVSDPTTAVQVLLDAHLLVARDASVRTVHALVRAAAYQLVPLPRRRELHLRAAATLTSPLAVLEHRVAATDRYDDALADELAAAAVGAHARGEYRLAGYLLRRSSGVTSEAAARSRRWLDALFEALLARDTTMVRREISEVDAAPDEARRALVQGMLLLVEKRWRDALTLLVSPSAEVLAGTDALTRYRLLLLAAWSRLGAGGDAVEVGALLARAAAESAEDPALRGYLIFTTGQVGMRTATPEVVRRTFDSVPARPSDTPVPQTFQLAWRGAVYAFSGMSSLADPDLTEVTSRMRGGMADFGDGVFHAILGYSRWLGGTWDLAAVELGIAKDAGLGQGLGLTVHPMTLAIEPLLLTVRGELAEADARLREVEVALQSAPWREAVYLLCVAQVARLHAGDDPHARRDLLPWMRRAFGDEFVATTGMVGGVWMLHMAIAAIWAGELDLAEQHVVSAESVPMLPDWTAWAGPWLRGLIAEARGDVPAAHALLAAAAAVPVEELPLYRAHLMADLARVARAAGDAVGADLATSSAQDRYRQLGAVPYLETSAPSAGPVPTVPELEALTMLSDRERDVVTLLVAGLSYAQIARDLYVTRSTVGFHLSNIYAKTGTTSRHGLTDLVRGRA